MTTTVKDLLVSFEQLSEDEKRDLALEIVRRIDVFGSHELSDEELVLTAEELFLELDREEAKLENQPA